MGANLLHDTRTFVSTDAGQPERHVAGHDVLVGVAHSRRMQLD